MTQHDFEPDSRLIRWDSCADEGAQEPVDYEDGLKQCGSHPSDWVLLAIACAIAAAAIFFPTSF